MLILHKFARKNSLIDEIRQHVICLYMLLLLYMVSYQTRTNITKLVYTHIYMHLYLIICKFIYDVKLFDEIYQI